MEFYHRNNFQEKEKERRGGGFRKKNLYLKDLSSFVHKGKKNSRICSLPGPTTDRGSLAHGRREPSSKSEKHR